MSYFIQLKVDLRVIWLVDIVLLYMYCSLFIDLSTDLMSRIAHKSVLTPPPPQLEIFQGLCPLGSTKALPWTHMGIKAPQIPGLSPPLSTNPGPAMVLYMNVPIYLYKSVSKANAVHVMSIYCKNRVIWIKSTENCSNLLVLKFKHQLFQWIRPMVRPS